MDIYSVKDRTFATADVKAACSAVKQLIKYIQRHKLYMDACSHHM
jgi:hypothetical protein